MMFLARARLDTSRAAVSWAARPYRIHQRLMMAYDGDPRLLFRVESVDGVGVQIIIQSHREPNWAAAFSDFPVLLGIPDHKPFDLNLTPGQVLAFRLRANPTVKRRFNDKDHKRVGLCREEDQIDWLKRKGEQAGFRLLSARTGRQETVTGALRRDGQKHDLQLLSVQFDGLLQVVDPDRLRQAVYNGIGSGKGLGFGLLSLARPPV